VYVLDPRKPDGHQIWLPKPLAIMVTRLWPRLDYWPTRQHPAPAKIAHAPGGTRLVAFDFADAPLSAAFMSPDGWCFCRDASCLGWVAYSAHVDHATGTAPSDVDVALDRVFQRLSCAPTADLEAGWADALLRLIADGDPDTPTVSQAVVQLTQLPAHAIQQGLHNMNNLPWLTPGHRP
jgi:hypothetical protein